jgi:hypothetical protein
VYEPECVSILPSLQEMGYDTITPCGWGNCLVCQEKVHNPILFYLRNRVVVITKLIIVLFSSNNPKLHDGFEA